MISADLPGDLTGANPLANWLNRIKRAVRKRSVLPGLGYKVRYTEAGTLLEILPGGGAITQEASPVQRFLIIAVRDDYYAAVTVSNTGQGTELMYVARPAKLRSSITSENFAGNVVTYTKVSVTSRIANFATFSENQLIVPWHLSGDHIYAVQPIGGTGVTTADPETVGETVEWLDINVDARAWALAFQT